MARWIFQDIIDLREKFLYGSDKPLKEKISQYKAALRACVNPEIYTQYLLWQCDIYVDVEQIEVVASHVYGTPIAQINEWIQQHKEPHHVLV